MAKHGKLPVPNFSAGGIATPADAALVMQLGAEAVFVGSGIFKSSDPGSARPRHRQSGHLLQRSREAARSQRRAGRGHVRPRYREAPRIRAAANARLVDGREAAKSGSACWRCRAISKPTQRALERAGRRSCGGAHGRRSRHVSTAWSSPAAKAPPCEAARRRKPARTAARIRAASARSSEPAPGAILLASQMLSNPPQASLGLMDIDVERNAYGRQFDSRIALSCGRGWHGWRIGSRLHPRTRSFAAWAAMPKCWPAIKAIRCWWSKAGIWWPLFIRN